MQIRRPNTFNTVELQLPGSKSESNRALILQALSEEPIFIDNLSDSDDTQIIKNALSNKASVIDCEQSGAALRFLCAYFSTQRGQSIILTGSQRLKERPLKILVDALKSLGAEIEYLEKTGYAPIKVTGKNLVSHQPIHIQADISSQFISALLMIAPRIKNGLQLHLENKIISAPYLKMTMEMMHQAKIHIIENDASIIIPEQEYQSCHITIEPDWSAASYWYGFVSLGLKQVKLNGFKASSIQGDKIISDWMNRWGVETIFEETGILLKKTNVVDPLENYDFVACPDIAQTLVVLAALHKHPLTFRGVESLALKETDRIEALKTELKKINIHWNTNADEHSIEHRNDVDPLSPINIDTYHDHRMAMAFALLSMRYEEIQIDQKNVVSKSYPSFWTDMQKVGFELV